MKRFKDRREAGKLLAEKLLGYKKEKPLVLALPRGGVPVGFEVALALEAPLDTLVARKIGVPANPEFGIGAIAPEVLLIDSESLATQGLRKSDIDPVIEKEKKEMERRIKIYRSGTYSLGQPVTTVIIVDDGLATGVTARAAIESIAIRYMHPKIIFVAPACSRSRALMLRDLVQVVCLHETDNFTAVGLWYEEFPQTSDEEVVALLEAAAEIRNPA